MLEDERHDATVDELKRQLCVEELETDLYRGPATVGTLGRVFGGQVIAQALAAASGSIGNGRFAHSLHAYFLRAGDNAKPIIYRVVRDFDGGSFANRRVVATQDGKPIFNLAASFQRLEDGLSHQAEMPDVAGPQDALPMSRVFEQRGASIPGPIADRLAAFDVRFGGAVGKANDPAITPIRHAWFKLDPRLGPELARIALAFVSDFGLISTAIMPHGIDWFSPEVQGASLDHAIWFHDAPPLDKWLLYTMESPWSGHARGFARGSVYDQAGRLIASMAQEGLMRHRPTT